MLLPNLPTTDLKPENDYLGLIPKADAIKQFLLLDSKEIKDFKMLALYGEWGSGKTSLMHYLDTNLSNEYSIFIFEAWKYEKDNNLALSLIDFLVSKSKSKAKVTIEKLKAISISLLKGFSKSISIDFIGLSVSPGAIIEQRESDEKERKENYSYYKIQEEFSKTFVKFEKSISKGKRVLVIIDDLDRCEPENVLNLISAIKLFFTFGKETVYLCGLDKKAVKSAIKVRYENVIKSDEYLEKVFDHSFNMPQVFYLKKFLEQYFIYQGIKDGTAYRTSDPVANFFYSLGFNNPRHLKKVLNKFVLLRRIKATANINSTNYELIPNIKDDESGNLVEIILTLFVILLWEFYPISFEMISNFDRKVSMIKEQFYNNTKDRDKPSISTSNTAAKKITEHDFYNRGINSISLTYNKDMHRSDATQYRNNVFRELLFLFTPTDVNNVYSETEFAKFIDEFVSSKETKLILFCNYIVKNQDLFLNDKSGSGYPIKGFYKMAKVLL